MEMRLKIISELAVETDSRIVLIVLDGLGDIPIPQLQGKTPLESADKPNMHSLSKKASLGVIEPISPGITPGSGPGHLGLFGYDPVSYQIGRGLIEGLGTGFEFSPDDVAARFNFATMNEDGIITDRRAGRINSDEAKSICSFLQEKITEIDGAKIFIRPVKEHRGVVIFRKKGLGSNIQDTDPQKTGLKQLEPVGLDGESENTAKIVKKFIDLSCKLLSGRKYANTLLLRGFSSYTSLPSFAEIYKLKPCAIATYPMYRGLASLAGMKLLPSGETLESEASAFVNAWDNYNFFFIHIKKTDSSGEDGNFQTKKKTIEEVDRIIVSAVIEKKPDVICITGDHSTPCLLKAHSWHPVPVLLYSQFSIPSMDGDVDFGERYCLAGTLGRIQAVDLMPLLLAHAGKMSKFGA